MGVWGGLAVVKWGVRSERAMPSIPSSGGGDDDRWDDENVKSDEEYDMRGGVCGTHCGCVGGVGRWKWERGLLNSLSVSMESRGDSGESTLVLGSWKLGRVERGLEGVGMALTQRREDGGEEYGSVEHCVRNTGFPLREEGGEVVVCSCRGAFVRLEKEGMCEHFVSLGVHCGACGEASRCSPPRRDGEGVCVECGRRETREEAGERKAASKLGRLKARMAKTKSTVKTKIKTKQKKRKGKAD